MKKTILLILLLSFISCSEEVIILDEQPNVITGKIGIDPNYVSLTTSDPYVEPSGDCFCKTTYRIRMWFDGKESLLHQVETPVGCKLEHGWYLADVLIYDQRSSQIMEYKTECKTEGEWDNYWDQCFHYDNEWFLCDYCLPYPVPYDVDLEAHGAGSNCLRE